MRLGLAVLPALLVLSPCVVQPAAQGATAARAVTREAVPDARASELLAFEHTMEEAVVKGDVAWLTTILPDDFTFTHGDGWTAGGQPIRVDTKATWLASVAKRPYVNRDLGPVAVELHGDIGITYGRYRMHMTSAPSGPETSVWFERVYALRNGRWMYLSHRTVHGPSQEGPARSAQR